MASVIVSLYNMPPGSNSTSSPYRSASRLLQHLELNLAHELDVDLAQRLVPDDVELRLFLFQTVEPAQCGMDIRALGQADPVAQHWFQHREVAVPLGPSPVPGRALVRPVTAQTCPGRWPLPAYTLRRNRAAAGWPFFGPGLSVRFAGELGFDLQLPAGDPQPGQPLAPLILRDFEHPGTKGFQRRGGTGVSVKAGQQLIHPPAIRRHSPLKGHAKPAGERRAAGRWPG